ncbi:MAG: hypothetical protein IKM84_01105 [Oscillospiraceae bacterium]|nr:hypothetical protein [Oscillospiraceae bacterium]
MNGFRFTLRFRADNEAERRAAEYLKSLKHGEQNRFLVGAVLSALEENSAASPECIRQIIREELAAALSETAISATTVPEQQNLTVRDVQTQDDLSILEDLELFG